MEPWILAPSAIPDRNREYAGETASEACVKIIATCMSFATSTSFERRSFAATFRAAASGRSTCKHDQKSNFI